MKAKKLDIQFDDLGKDSDYGSASDSTKSAPAAEETVEQKAESVLRKPAAEAPRKSIPTAAANGSAKGTGRKMQSISSTDYEYWTGKDTHIWIENRLTAGRTRN